MHGSKCFDASSGQPISIRVPGDRQLQIAARILWQIVHQISTDESISCAYQLD